MLYVLGTKEELTRYIWVQVKKYGAKKLASWWDLELDYSVSTFYNCPVGKCVDEPTAFFLFWKGTKECTMLPSLRGMTQLPCGCVLSCDWSVAAAVEGFGGQPAALIIMTHLQDHISHIIKPLLFFSFLFFFNHR